MRWATGPVLVAYQIGRRIERMLVGSCVPALPPAASVSQAALVDDGQFVLAVSSAVLRVVFVRAALQAPPEPARHQSGLPARTGPARR